MSSWVGLCIGVAGLIAIIMLAVLAWSCESKQRRRIAKKIRKNQKIIDAYPRHLDDRGHPSIQDTDECLQAFRENVQLQYDKLPRF